MPPTWPGKMCIRDSSSNDFGKNIIPNMLAAGEKLMTYRFSGYWKDVGTINSLWDANMDMLAPHSGIDLYDPSWPIYARSPIKPPHVTGPNAQISHSLVTGGCQVDGSVENSVLFHSVTVEEGADVQYSILMPGAVVKKGAVVAYAIVAENAVIGEEATIGAPPSEDPDWGIAVVGGGVAIGDKAGVKPRDVYKRQSPSRALLSLFTISLLTPGGQRGKVVRFCPNKKFFSRHGGILQKNRTSWIMVKGV